MGYMKKVLATAKVTPKAVWIASIIVPGGLIAVSAWIGISSAFRAYKQKCAKDKIGK